MTDIIIADRRTLKVYWGRRSVALVSVHLVPELWWNYDINRSKYAAIGVYFFSSWPPPANEQGVAQSILNAQCSMFSEFCGEDTPPSEKRESSATLIFDHIASMKKVDVWPYQSWKWGC